MSDKEVNLLLKRFNQGSFKDCYLLLVILTIIGEVDSCSADNLYSEMSLLYDKDILVSKDYFYKFLLRLVSEFKLIEDVTPQPTGFINKLFKYLKRNTYVNPKSLIKLSPLGYNFKSNLWSTYFKPLFNMQCNKND